MKKPNPKVALTLAALLLIFSSVFSQKEKDRIANYIAQYKDLAMQEMVQTGIPASITLAQGLLETGFGQSDLAQNANNHFGIKCKSDWTGESVLHDDDKKGECFRKYASVEDSYRDHSNFLKRPNYAFLFSIDPVDYKGWAFGLKKAGYATNPVYAQRLIKFIEDNNLQEFTLLALNDYKQKNEAVASVQDIEVKNTVREEATVKPTDAVMLTAPAVESETKIFYGKQVDTPVEKASAYPKDKPFTINATKVIFAEAGTSLLAVATNNSIAYTRLLEFNDLDKKDILENGQLIFLEKKQRKGLKDVHVVAGDETLHGISQTEGIQLNSILEYNHLTKGDKVVAGQKLYLKATSPVSTKIADANTRTTKSDS